MDSTERLIERVMGLPYHRVVVRDPEGTYSGQVLEFDGCFSGGETAAEAIEGLDEAMQLWIEEELDRGREVPIPFGSQGYSGRINLRLPESLHEKAALRAEVEGTSLNQVFVTAISEYLAVSSRQRRGWGDVFSVSLAPQWNTFVTWEADPLVLGTVLVVGAATTEHSPSRGDLLTTGGLLSYGVQRA